jgi:hypothetical protein
MSLGCRSSCPRPVEQLQERPGFEHREGEQQQDRRDELRPAEDRHAAERHALGAHVEHRHDEVDRAEERRRDHDDHREHQIVCPGGATTESGAYEVQPDCGQPSGAKKLDSMTMPPTK